MNYVYEYFGIILSDELATVILVWVGIVGKVYPSVYPGCQLILLKFCQNCNKDMIRKKSQVNIY